MLDVQSLDSKNRQEFLSDCKGGKYRHVGAMYRHFKGDSTKVSHTFHIIHAGEMGAKEERRLLTGSLQYFATTFCLSGYRIIR